MNIEIRHLRGFVAVAEELNFSRAAARLHLAQQSLSAQIQQLERELRVQLLARSTRHVELTEAGQVLYTHTLKILHQLETAEVQTRRIAAGVGIELQIAATPTLAELVSRLLDACAAQSPDISLLVHEMWQGESVEAVTAGRLDIGIARAPVLGEDLDSFSLQEEPLGVVLGEAHSQFGKSIIDFSDLAEDTLVIWPRTFSPNYYDQVVHFCRSHGFVGEILPLQLLTADSFLRDPRAKSALDDGRGFTVAFESEVRLTRSGYGWHPTSPALSVGSQMYWRRDAGRGVQRIVEVARFFSRAGRK